MPSTAREEHEPDRSLREFVARRFGKDLSRLEALPAGESARPFLVEVGGDQLVIRFDRSELRFLKDRRAARRFGAVGLPIPETLEVGQNGPWHYSLCRAVAGRPLGHRRLRANKRLADELARVMRTIHAHPIEDTEGFGDWDESGRAPFRSWRAFLESRSEALECTYPDAFLYGSMLDTELFDAACEEVEKLVPACPEQRHLIHGDFGFDNVLVEGDRVTAILDWGESLYGDPLYDLAHLSFWAPRRGPLPFVAAFLAGADPAELERLRCYGLLLGLGGLCLFASRKRRQAYQRTAERLTARLVQG